MSEFSKNKPHAVRSTKACTSNVRGDFTSTSSRNCKQTRDLKRGIRGRLRNSSPLVSLLDKRVFKFKVRIFKREICYFVNFKIPFTRKNWLLKFGFAYRLAQILEPKLLVHKILKFVRNFLEANCMQCFSTIACTLNVRGGFYSGFAS